MKHKQENRYRNIQFFTGCPLPFVLWRPEGGIHSYHASLEHAVAARDLLERRDFANAASSEEGEQYSV